MCIEWRSTHDLTLILKHLKKLDRKVNSFWYTFSTARWTGICLYIDDHSGVKISHSVLCDLFSSWDKFSGEYNYPVPSPTSGMTPRSAFSNLPKWKGEYGKLRKELLKHCIATLEQDIIERVKA